MQAEAALPEEGPCSKSDAQAVLTATDQTAAVMGMLATNAPCALCIIPCAGEPMPDAIRCVNKCQHQRENRCDDSTGVARVSPMIDAASLSDRDSVIRLLQAAEADCVYCILETVESVCGGCVRDKLHLSTDYQVLPRQCLPELAAALTSSQARMVRETIDSASSFGLIDTAHARVTDIYVATGAQHSGAAVYRGLNLGSWMYRCTEGTLPDETWALSDSDDNSTWGTCEGRLWIALETMRARTDRTDPSQGIGVNFDRLEECSHISSSLESAMTVTRDSSGSPVVLSFSDASTELQVACGLFWKFGPHATVDDTSLRWIVQLPRTIDAVPLVGDLIVRTGQSLELVSPQIGAVAIHVGGHCILVERDGALALLRLELTDSWGSSAVHSEGILRVTNSTFSRCRTGISLVAKFVEGLVVEGDGINIPVAGAFLGSTGGAVFNAFSVAKCILIGSTLSDNACNGDSAVAALGAAIWAFGGVVELESTVLRRNVANGDRRMYASWGAAVMLMFARLNATDTSFVENLALGPAKYAMGGAIGAHHSRITAQAVVFEANAVSGGSQSTRGGAVDLEDKSTFNAASSVFCHNEANGQEVSSNARGGAICAGNSRFTCETTTFDSNRVLDGLRLSTGGALALDSSTAWLGVNTSFSANVARGKGGLSVYGGAISVESETSLELGNVYAVDLLAANAVVFTENVAEGSDPKAGALYVGGGRVVNLEGATFESNRVLVRARYGAGGAVHIESGEAHLTHCRFTGNVARMTTPTAYDATAGGVSVGAQGILYMTDSRMLSNYAGGVGHYEKSATASGTSQAILMERAAHVFCIGKAVIERCTFEFRLRPDDELGVENSAKSFLVGKQAGRILLANSTLVGSESQAVIGLFDTAEAVIRGCSASGMTLNPEVLVQGRLGIVNSTFDPPLPANHSPLAVIDCSAVPRVDVAGERVCDPRATCKPRPSGGVQCACIGEGLQDMPATIPDGRACEQEIQIRMQAQSQKVVVMVQKPSASPEKVRILVFGQGEQRFDAAYTMSMHVEYASSAGMNSTSWPRIDAREYSFCGQHVVWSVPMSTDSVFAFSREEQQFALNKEFEMEIRLDCGSARPCIGDGDVVSTVLETGTPSSPSSLRSKVTVTAQVISLIACEKARVWLEGGVESTVVTSVPIRLHLSAFDVDGLPIRFRRLETEFRFGEHLLPVQWCAVCCATGFHHGDDRIMCRTSGSNEYIADVASHLTANPGGFDLVVTARNGWSMTNRSGGQCELLRRTITVQAVDYKGIIVGASVAAVALLLCLGIAAMFCLRRHQDEET
jgi:hypothetical protein